MSSNFVLVLLTLAAVTCNAQSPSPSPSPPTSPSPSPVPSSVPPTSTSPSPSPPPTGTKNGVSLHAISVPPKGSIPSGDITQQQCQGVPARRRFKAGSMDDYWAVVKTTPLPNPTPPEFKDDINFCHPFSYKPGTCQGISLYYVPFEDDHSVTFHTFGYNNVTKSMNHFATNYQKTDPYYAVYQGQPAYMEEIFDNGKHKLVDPIPQFILDSQGVEFAQVGKGSNRWAIFQACVSKAAFVILNADTRLRDLLLREDEYLAELKRLNIDVNTLVDVPIKRNRYDEP